MSDCTPALRRLAVIAASLLVMGCAHTWTDAQGQRHVLGLVHLELPAADPADVAAETLRVRTVGLSWTRAEAGSALLLGYGDTTLGFLRNDSCVAPVRLTRREASW